MVGLLEREKSPLEWFWRRIWSPGDFRHRQALTHVHELEWHLLEFQSIFFLFFDFSECMFDISLFSPPSKKIKSGTSIEINLCRGVKKRNWILFSFYFEINIFAAVKVKNKRRSRNKKGELVFKFHYEHPKIDCKFVLEDFKKHVLGGVIETKDLGD